jgi:sugar/nucleoside kinase (ribokinase family)
MNSRETAGIAEIDKSSHQPDVAIVGEINPDLIVYGLPRDLPEEREILASECQLMLGSSSAILAHNLSVLGSQVTFSSRVGNDLFADLCLHEMESAGVDVQHVVRIPTGKGTGITVILPLASTRRILTYPGAMFEMTLGDLDLDFIARAKHFHLSSVFLHRKLLADIPHLFKEMKRRGLTTSLDTNDDPEGLWRGVVEEILPHVDLLFCTEDEVRKIAKVDDAESFLSSRVPVLVVKRGARGATVFSDGPRIDAPALSVDVVDTVGAGDTFDAGFLHQWLQKALPEICLSFGNLTAGLSVTRPGGTAAFRDAEYRTSFFERHWQEGVLTP